MPVKNYIFAVLMFLFIMPLSAQDFKEEQLQNGRVKNAYQEKEEEMRSLIQYNQLDLSSLEIFIRAFKKEKKLEVWGRDSLHQQFVLLKTYRICRTSGDMGPKRKQGDGQIPEGFYHINRFNPWSNFYLSLGLNYPNASDLILSDKKKPGGDIFIHGSCVTIGCMPMTDDLIKEIYILAVEARNNGQENIPVHIFPLKMKGEAYIELLEEHRDDDALKSFWNNLEEGYLYFEMNKIPPTYILNKDGSYCFQ